MHPARLSVQIKASLLLASALVLAHGAATACVVMFLPEWWMSGTAASAISASFVFHLRRDALQLSADAVTSIGLIDQAQCELVMRNGTKLTGSIEGTSFAAPLLTIINVRPHTKGRRRAAILMPDSAPAADLRSIRVWLRHRAKADAPDSSAF